jgi:hypothetical protein
MEDAMTKTQEKQMRFLEKMEHREVQREMRGGGWGSLANYDVTCRDCGDSIVCHVPDTAIQFIYEHENHRTWVTYMGRTRN